MKITVKLPALALGALVSTLFVIPAVALGEEAGSHTVTLAKDFKWDNAPPSLPPGAKVTVLQGAMDAPKPFTARVKFPANYRIPAHSHPTDENLTVLSGAFHMGIGDKFDKNKATTLSTGDFSAMPAKTNHYAWTEKETVVQITGTGPWGITYVDPKDDPRNR